MGFSLYQGVLYWWVESKSQLVVLETLCPQLLLLAHDPLLVGHLGPEKMLERILLQFYWLGVQALVHK